MNKNELVIEVMNLCDENERLKNELKIIKNDSLLNQKVIEKQPSRMTLTIIQFGEREILRNCLYSWEKVRVDYDKENDVYKTTSFEGWLTEKLRKDCIPKSISQVEFEEYFNNQLHEMYEKEKDEALREAKGIENVEDE